MAFSNLFVLLLLSLPWSFFILSTNGIQSSQKQVLLQVRKQLEYPKPMEILLNSSADLCSLSSSQVNFSCQDGFVTELRIVGDKPNQVSDFHGFPIPYKTLSGNFSMDSFVATLSRLTSLRTLTLISVGLLGPIPDKIYRLSSLEHLDFSWNFLFGSIPPTVSRLVNLQSVTLDGNYLNGTFPDSFGSLPSLISISMKKNGLSGKLSEKLPKGLVMLFLSNNSFSGEIPKRYGQLHQLQQLDLSYNSLTGTPPAELFSLQVLSYLNLGSNMLSGSLPAHLGCGNGLGFVDISNNKFSGMLPPCLSNKNIVRYDGNCLLNDVKNQHPETYCNDAHIVNTKSTKRSLGLVLGVIGGIVGFLVLLAFCCLVLGRRFFAQQVAERHLLHKSVVENSVPSYPSELLTSARYISEAAKIAMLDMPLHRLFSFDELKEATKNFDKSALIGEGSPGKLYKGRLANGSQVAVRHLIVSKKYTSRNLKLRLGLLARLRHPHLVCLLGHCIDDNNQDGSGANKVYLVYEYVPNGNYRARLNEPNMEKGFKWSDRLAVLTDIAQAVHFLHTGIIPGFFNNKLKANNILLNEHGVAKLSDYGLSIISDEIENDDAEGERTGLRQMKSMEDDVHSFGFILLESLTGPSFTARKEELLMNDMANLRSEDRREQLVDPIVVASCSQESLSVIISITNKCFSADPSARPSFEDVLWHLQYAAQVQVTATEDRENKFSPWS